MRDPNRIYSADEFLIATNNTDRQPKARNTAIDALRGFAMILMLFVDVAGPLNPWLAHATWSGCKIADLAMPLFLFCLGAAVGEKELQASREASEHGRLCCQTTREVVNAVVRGLKLFALGIVIQGSWIPSPSNHKIGFDLSTVRVFGILQRIGMVYVGLVLIVKFLPRCVTWIAPFGAMALHAFLLFGVRVPGCEGGCLEASECMSLGYIDRKIVGASHLINGIYDPEGIGSTIASFCVAFLGFIVVRMTPTGSESTRDDSLPYQAFEDEFNAEALPSRVQAVVQLLKRKVALGSILTIIGLILSFAIPFNKTLWTPSFNFFTAGICCIALEVVERIPDLLLKPLIWLGSNALFFFVMSDCGGLLSGLIASIWVDAPYNNAITWVKLSLTSVFGMDPAKGIMAYATVQLVVFIVWLKILYNQKKFYKI